MSGEDVNDGEVATMEPEGAVEVAEPNDPTGTEAAVEAFTAEPEVGATADAGGETESAAFAPELLTRAERDYGLKAEDLAGLDAGGAERLFAAVDRRVIGQAAGPPAAEPTEKPPEATPEPAGVEFKPFELNLANSDGEVVIDESVSGPMQSIVAHVNDQMKQLHAWKQAAVAEIGALNQLQVLDRFDRVVASLGDEWHGVYGKGPTLDLDQQGSEYKQRLTMFNGGQGLSANAVKGGQHLSESGGWLRSHRSENLEKIMELERKKSDVKVAARRTQFGERTGKAGKEPVLSPRDAAIKEMSGITG